MSRVLQQVNLYHPTFQQRKVVFSAVAAGFSLVVFLVLYGTVFGLMQWRIEGLRDIATQAQQGHAQTNRQFAKMIPGLAPRKKDPVLLLQLERKLKELSKQRSILQFMENKMQREEVRFSRYLVGLARQDIEGLWLEQIQIGKSGEALALRGKTTSPELVPRLLGRLSKEEPFYGKGFHTLSFSRDKEKQQWIDFSLSTKAEKKGGKS